MVFYSQRDPKWADVIYSAQKPHTETIKSAGCGITCAASVISSFADPAITPVEMACYSVARGYRIDGVGTANALFGSVAKNYGLEMDESTSFATAKKCLDLGGLVVCGTSGNPRGIFSTGGHFFILCGVDGSRLKFWDPDNYTNKYKTKNRGRYAMLDAQGFVWVNQGDAVPEINRYFCFYQPAEKKEEKPMEKIYHYTQEVPEWGRPTVQKLLDRGYYAGAAADDLNLPETMLRTFVVMDRAGAFDKGDK